MARFAGILQSYQNFYENLPEDHRSVIGCMSTGLLEVILHNARPGVMKDFFTENFTEILDESEEDAEKTCDILERELQLAQAKVGNQRNQPYAVRNLVREILNQSE